MKHLLILALHWLIEIANKLLLNHSYYITAFTAVRITGHRGIVLQTNNENVTLMVLEEFSWSFYYASFRAWIEATTLCVHVCLLGAETVLMKLGVYQSSV